MLGLKSKLNIYIQDKKYATLDEVYAFAQSLGYKQKTAERELNESRSPDIETIKNSKGQIQGYKHRISSKMPPSKDTCPHCNVWLNHSINCPTKAQKSTQGALNI